MRVDAPRASFAPPAFARATRVDDSRWIPGGFPDEIAASRGTCPAPGPDRSTPERPAWDTGLVRDQDGPGHRSVKLVPRICAMRVNLSTWDPLDPASIA